MEVVRWVFGSVSRRSVPCATRCGRRVGRRWHDASITSSSGRQSHGAFRARTPEWRRGCRRQSGPGGSVTLAGCRQSVWPRFRGGICRLLNARISPSCMPNRSVCARSLGVWAATPRRSWQGAWAQRLGSDVPPGVPGLHGPVVCRKARTSPQSVQAGCERAAARVRQRSSCWRDHAGRRWPCAGARCALHRPPPRTPQGSALGQIVEPTADRQPPCPRLPR